MATGSSVDVFAPKRRVPRQIPGPQGLHGTSFGGNDKKTLFGIVFYGVGDAERAKPGHRDSDDRAGLHGPREVVPPFVR